MTIEDIRKLSRPALRSEVAQVLGCDVRTVDRAIQDGTVQAFRIGRRVYIPVGPLLNLLEGFVVKGL